VSTPHTAQLKKRQAADDGCTSMAGDADTGAGADAEGCDTGVLVEKPTPGRDGEERGDTRQALVGQDMSVQECSSAGDAVCVSVCMVLSQAKTQQGQVKYRQTRRDETKTKLWSAQHGEEEEEKRGDGDRVT
jgi:hypothetical protein